MLSTCVLAQTPKADDIVAALKQGNANQFCDFFDSFIDIKMPDKDEVNNVGKTQATITIKNFFDQAGIKGFEMGSEREIGGTMYLTGKLQGEKDYNLTIMTKNKGDKYAIITIRVS